MQATAASERVRWFVYGTAAAVLAVGTRHVDRHTKDTAGPRADADSLRAWSTSPDVISDEQRSPETTNLRDDARCSMRSGATRRPEDDPTP